MNTPCREAATPVALFVSHLFSTNRLPAAAAFRALSPFALACLATVTLLAGLSHQAQAGQDERPRVVVASAEPPLGVADRDGIDRTAAYGPEIARWTEEDRHSQRLAGQDMIRMIQNAIDAGQRRIVIPKGHYRFGRTPNPNSPRSPHIFFRNVDNLTVDFNGSTLWFESTSTAIATIFCENLTLKNLTVDYDPLPFTQGTVMAVDRGADEIVLKLDEAYQIVGPVFAAFEPGDRGTIRGAIFEPDTRQLKEKSHGWRALAFWQNKVAPRTYRVPVRGFAGVGVEEIGFEKGHRVAIWLRRGRTIRTGVSGAVTWENMNLYASGFVGFAEARGVGPTTYRNVNIVRRPGTNRLIACNADGWNSANMVNGPRLESCTINYAMDDALNVHGLYLKVLWQESPTEIIVDPLPGQIQDSLTLNFYQLDRVAHVGERNATHVRTERWELRKDRSLFSEATGWNAGEFGGRLPYGDTIRVDRLTLAEPIEIPPGTIMEVAELTGAGAVVRDCTVDTGFARGLKFASNNILVEGNYIARQEMSGIALMNHPSSWGESSLPFNAVIRDNVVEDVCIIDSNDKSWQLLQRAAILVQSQGDLTVAKPVENIVIENNVIRGPRAVAIALRGVRDIRVTGNRIQPVASFEPYMRPAPGDRMEVAGHVLLDAVSGLEMSGNELVRP